MTRRRTTTRRRLAAAGVALAAVAGCSPGASTSPTESGPGLGTPQPVHLVSLPGGARAAIRALPVAVPRDGVAGPGQDKYTNAVDVAAANGLQVWIDTDLVKHWLAGPVDLAIAVRRVAGLASRPGVVGIRYANELGYKDGLLTPEQVQRFLSETSTALRAAAPRRSLLVDLYVPELGCQAPVHATLPGASLAASCRTKARDKHPTISIRSVTGYLRSHAIDVVNLSTGLLAESSYRDMGWNRQQAQIAAWREVHRLRWSSLVHMAARKAMAHPGIYEGSATDAEYDLRVFVDTPTASGARAVDIWTWRQTYQGQVVRLLDPGLQDNELWQRLLQRRRAGVALLTHFTPSSVESDVATDMKRLSAVFTGVYVAAGTG